MTLPARNAGPSRSLLPADSTNTTHIGGQFALDRRSSDISRAHESNSRDTGRIDKPLAVEKKDRAQTAFVNRPQVLQFNKLIFASTN